MTPFRSVPWLAAFITILAAIAAGVGLLQADGGAPYPFTTVRGETVQIFGRGVYRYDSLFSGAAYRGQDLVTLALGIPLLIITTWFYRRGSRQGGLLLTGALAYFLYVYASMALYASFNSLFLVYVALFSASFFAFALTFTSLDLPASTIDKLPRRGPGIYMLAAGVMTLAVWLGPLLSAVLAGKPPALLGHKTTMVTDALDLALITPAAIWSGLLILRRAPLGYRLAFPLLGLIIMLLLIIVLGTIFQLKAGIAFSPGEIIGPISGFAVLGGLGAWVMAAVLRRMPEGPAES